ncbi:hypothetical protein ACYJ1Y_16590 [Natrialbaceae archaeon A-gly3]
MSEEPDEGEKSGEEKSFRERVEEIREKRAQEGEGEGERPEGPFGGGGPGGPGGMGGNPFAQMMGGMMGGGPGGPGGPGGEEVGNEELVREVRQLRDEMRDQTRALKRIADALEDE